MTSRFYRIEDNGSGEADILLYGAIGESWFEESVTARQLVTDIKALEKKHTLINVKINSPGGSVFDGLAIFNALKNSTAEIHTWNDGLAASMAAMILLAGDKVHAAKNSLMMIHSPSTGVWGNARDIREALSALDKVQESLVECLLTRTSKTREDIQSEYFDYTDHWLSAAEALGENFIDEVIEKKAAVNQKVAALNYQELVNRFGQMAPEEKKRGRLVAFFENLFTHSETEQTNTQDEMDIKSLQAALSLGEAATETDILDSIKKLNTELTAEKAAKENAQKELETFKKEPGASPAAVDVATDALKETEGAGSFTDALAYCFNVLKK